MGVICGVGGVNGLRQYAFLRKYENEVLLIIANFESIPVRIGVNVPQHAFDFLQMPVMEKYTAQDLLSGKEEVISWMPDKPITLDLPALGGKMLKIAF